MTATVHTRRIVDAAASTLADHVRRLGTLPDVPGPGVLQMVADSGLGGRGGAAFPTGRKLAAVRAGSGPAVVVANGAEGEPASSKDRMLLTTAPHLVLDGLALTARALGTADTHLYAPADLLDGPVASALRERPERVHLVDAPDTFVSGQESAVVAAVAGRRAVPSDPQPPVFVRGVGGRPTLVQNVETLAHIALIARYGPQWFRSAGTPAEPGTRLATVSGAVASPGVYELAGGAPLFDLLSAAGGPREPLQALLVGGYHGGWVPWNDATAAVPWTRDALHRWDAAPGAGVVIALPAGRCGLRAGAEITGYLAGQSAGQCGPCRNGLPAAANLLAAVAHGRADQRTVAELHRIVGLVDGRGACRHPDGTARLVRSTLRTFAHEVGLHLQGHCSAVVTASGRRPGRWVR